MDPVTTAVAEHAPVSVLVLVLLAREARAWLQEREAKQRATLDDLSSHLQALSESVNDLKSEIRSLFEERTL